MNAEEGRRVSSISNFRSRREERREEGTNCRKAIGQDEHRQCYCKLVPLAIQMAVMLYVPERCGRIHERNGYLNVTRIVQGAVKNEMKTIVPVKR
jgi:hypothetical protein